MTNIDIEREIYSYAQIILDFERVVKIKYDLTSVRWLRVERFPKVGTVILKSQEVSYRFHGSGCTFSVDKVEVNYNVDVGEVDYLVTSPWFFFRYCTTKYSELEGVFTEQSSHMALLELEQKGILKRDDIPYSGFRISSKWLESRDGFKS